MKRIIPFFVLFWLVGAENVKAQTTSPNGMIYQAVARDGSGNLAAKRS
ncbi:MAG: hypothetical protein RIT07_1637, partial [Bacteroidota bacterium]